ncbi:hypothetical protein BX600DRAFT_548932 [Xylariales sp. PMI_506]|nr:hypothetical protein BX600DRAFT_548932 [Xylariales sp. PMI_506]
MSQARIIFGRGIVHSGDDARTKTLTELIQANHDQFGLLYSQSLHNHTQHVLSAAYQMNASVSFLRQVYSSEASSGILVPWSGRPTGRIVTETDVLAHLGDASYERDYVDYFAKVFGSNSQQEWPELLQYYLLDCPKPLLTGLIGGFGHPMLLLADAVELGSGVLAADSLALNCVDYGPLSRIVDILLAKNSHTPVISLSAGSAAAIGDKAGKMKKMTPLETLEALRNDARFNGAITTPGLRNLPKLLGDPPLAAALLSYAGTLPLLPGLGGDHRDDNPSPSPSSSSASSSPSSTSTLSHELALRELVDTAVLLLLTTHKQGEPAFDFFLAHNLSFCNCLRILVPAFEAAPVAAAGSPDDSAQQPLVPAPLPLPPPLSHRLTLLRIHWLLTLLSYITQGRPHIKPYLLNAVPIAHQWSDLRAACVGQEGRQEEEEGYRRAQVRDEHFVKAIGILDTFASLWPDRNDYLLKAANKLMAEFDRWTGQGVDDETHMDMTV